MALIRNLLAGVFLAGSCLGRNIAQADAELVKRDAVNDCKNVLVALKASSFCSSFVPITDSTVTTTTTAPTTTTTTTITLPDCYTIVATNTITNTATSTETDTLTITVTVAGNPPNRKRAASSRTSTTTSTTSVKSTAQAITTTAALSATTAAAQVSGKTTTTGATATSASCTIKGLPVQLNLFTCDVIKQACLLFVKPQTSTSTSTVTPTSTASVSTQPPCISVTASATTSTSTTVTVTTTITATSYQPTPSCNGNYVTSNTGTRFCQFFAGYQARNSFAFYTTQFYDSTTSDGDAIQNCANFVSSSGNGVAQTFQVFYVPSESRWHCDTSLASNCDSNFRSNTYVNQMYQYNVVGSVCS